jgi:hypothetical protein
LGVFSGEFGGGLHRATDRGRKMSMRQVFEILPPTGSGFAVLLTFLVLLLGGILALFTYFAYGSRNSRVELHTDSLRIRAPMYGRTVRFADLEIGRAQIVDLEKQSEHGLSWRTNGMGLPGYQAGWFRTRAGEKALAFVTDRRQVVYLPTRQEYSMLLSVKNPEAFLAALRSSATNR